MSRILARLSPEQFAAANQAYLKNWSSDEEEVLAYIEANLPDRRDPSTLSVVSIGAGNGRRDIDILRVLTKAFPGVGLRYAAIDPNANQMGMLKTAFDEATDLTLATPVEAHVMEAQNFTFAENSYDVVLFIHSLYFMKGAEEKLIRDAYASLKPGGRVYLAITTSQGGMYRLMSTFWQTIDYSHFEEGGGIFSQEKLHAMLQESFSDVDSDLLPLPNLYIDVADCFDETAPMGRDLLNFVMQADVAALPADLQKAILERLDELAPDRGDGVRPLVNGNGVAVMRA